MARVDHSTGLLAIGSAVGLVLAAGGLLASGRDPGRDLPADAIARVNGVAIRAEDYRRALDAVTADRREPPDATLRRHVLDRLIDEELIVQRGLELGLARVDPRLRPDLADAVIGAATTTDAAADPTPAELAAFYEAEGAFFTRPGRVHVRQVFVAATTIDAEGRAADAAARLRAGATLPAVRDALADPDPVTLPDGPLPAAKLAEYLGPTPLRAVLGLEPGGITDPVRSTAGLHVLM